MSSAVEHIERGRRAMEIARAKGLHVPKEWHDQLRVLIDEEVASWPWMLREWRRVSIPQWHGVLDESKRDGPKHREQYARWMLRDVLLDPDYEEPHS